MKGDGVRRKLRGVVRARRRLSQQARTEKENVARVPIGWS